MFKEKVNFGGISINLAKGTWGCVCVKEMFVGCKCLFNHNSAQSDDLISDL